MDLPLRPRCNRYTPDLGNPRMGSKGRSQTLRQIGRQDGKPRRILRKIAYFRQKTESIGTRWSWTVDSLKIKQVTIPGGNPPLQRGMKFLKPLE
ncbi:MAG: hypothetical protein KatS3mg107_0654 [Gemmataceae bacterium]|nr:MAG: hypothetical protein KatS3mg107_0654 [Gemmataceae bacterium]